MLKKKSAAIVGLSVALIGIAFCVPTSDDWLIRLTGGYPAKIRSLRAASVEGGSWGYYSPDYSPLSEQDVADIKRYVSAHPDHSAYHMLIALRDEWPDEYASLPADTRAKVLTSAMGHLQDMADFNPLLPKEGYDPWARSQPDRAGEALLEAGEIALPYLVPLLSDRTRVSHFDGYYDYLADKQQWRRCDYAHWYIMLIMDRDPVFHEDPADRDKEIAKLLKEFEAGQPATQPGEG